MDTPGMGGTGASRSSPRPHALPRLSKSPFPYYRYPHYNYYYQTIINITIITITIIIIIIIIIIININATACQARKGPRRSPGRPTSRTWGARLGRRKLFNIEMGIQRGTR